MDFLRSAFELCQWGWKVFPLAPGSKIPAISKRDGGRGCLDATNDAEKIAEWHKRFPAANIGVACGEPSGIIVVDLDPRNGSEETIEKFRQRKWWFPDTVSVRTANGGLHLYYAFEPSLKNSKSVLGKGIDVKTTGGYVVAPPSVLDGGKRYEWLLSPLGDHLPRPPMWMVQALRPKPDSGFTFNQASAPRDISALVRTVATAPEGSRNNVLYWAACRAAEGGLLTKAAADSFADAAQACGLNREDALKSIASAARRRKLT